MSSEGAVVGVARRASLARSTGYAIVVLAIACGPSSGPDAGPLRDAATGTAGDCPFEAPRPWPIPRAAFHVDDREGELRHAVLDLDGDLRPDFVTTHDGLGTVGITEWLVHRNTGTGFAEVPERWSIPRRAAALHAQGDASAAVSLHSVFDIDGDERPDFVVTYDISGAAGEREWLVYRNTGSGFASEAARWPIPRRALRAEAQGEATWAEALHTVLDMDGDRRPDFVVTYDISGAAGEREWLVYRNTGEGFASEAARWPIPRRALHAEAQGEATWAEALHTVLDMDGDRRPDFVVTYDRSGAAGEREWLVYRNGGEGFEATASPWTIPRRALHLRAQGSATWAVALHSAFDIDGDLRPDFVVTYDMEGTGERSWLVGLGGCDR